MKLENMYLCPYFRAVEYAQHFEHKTGIGVYWHWLCACTHESQHVEACMVVLSGNIGEHMADHFHAREHVHPFPHILDKDATMGDIHVQHLGHLGITKNHNAFQVRQILRAKLNKHF